ncbi:MAG: type II secretion system protein GspE, partial [Lachnospiraceae bacterium]|nr:type II secretion system protein GspE [Lachnospiraceae bacterium]
MEGMSGRARRKKRLGDILQEAGIVTEENVLEALKVQKESNKKQKLGVTLVDLGFTTDEDIAGALSKQLNLPRIRLSDIKIDEIVLGLVDEKMLRKYMLMPYGFDEKNPNIL